MIVWLGARLVVVALAIVSACPHRSDAGDLPRPTKEGVEALLKLIDRCVAGGGLRPVKGVGKEDAHYEVADASRLAEIVRAKRASIGRPLVDALAGGWESYDEKEEPFAIATLRAIGAKCGDARAAGFGALFAAQVAARARGAKGAVAFFDEAAGHFEAAGERGWQATSQHEAGVTLRKLGDLGGAIDHYHRALEIRLDVLGADDPLVATTYNNLGTAYDASGDLLQAEENFLKALAIRQKVLPADDPALASSFRNLSLLAFRAGRLDQSADLLARALAIRRRNAGKDPEGLADALNGLGVVLSERGDLREAGRLFEQALEIQRNLGAGAELDLAVTLSNMGVAAERAGDYPRAVDLFGRMLSIRRRRLPPRHPEIAHALGLLSKLHNDLGDHAKAVELGEEALSIRRQFFGPDHPDVARSLNNLGGIYQDQGDDPAALDRFRHALATWKKAYPGMHPDIGFCLDNIAGVLRRRGDWAGALASYREALPILRATLGPRHPEVSACLLGIGATHRSAGRPAEAMASFRDAVGLARAAGAAGRVGLVPALNQLASEEADQGDLAGAERDLRESLGVARVVLGANHPGVARTLAEASSLRRRAGDIAGATRLIDEAIETLGGRPGGGLPETGLSLDLLSRRARLLQSGLGERPSVSQLAACASAFEEAAGLLERLREAVLASREGKLRAGEESADLFPRLVEIRRRLSASGDRAANLEAGFAAAERGTARVFLESLGRSRADRLGGVAPALVRQLAMLQPQLVQLDRRLDEERGRPVERRRPEAIGLLEERRAGLVEESGRLVRRVEAEYPRFASLKSPRPCSVEEARETLLDDEVALLFVPGVGSSSLVVLSKVGATASGGLEIHRLPPAETIAELVASMTSPKVLGDVEKARDRGAEAYRMLLEPVAESIRGRALVIVAGGPLGLLPFELLVEPGAGGAPGRFLGEARRIRYAPSLTTLRMVDLWEKARARPDRPLWAMADPVYGRSDPRLKAGEPAPGVADRAERATDSAMGFDRLPATGLEASRLAALMGAGPEDLFVGLAALEDTVKQLSETRSLAGYRYVHFATHGVLEGGDRGQPALVLSLVGDQRGEDGYLTLDEVTGLTLDADLVVLSACRTGQGEAYRAEGVDGLARAFLFAGSRGVACSLWRVDDESTAELMADFYAGLKAGLPAAEALRSAQVKLLEAGEPPLHWAPFILVGK